ncbi:MAG: hypothetical protein NTY74_12840 [Ignavibacteriae bacterium]|nr:hypothetical protein [Ignavibacteriota bacterium]
MSRSFKLIVLFCLALLMFCLPITSFSQNEDYPQKEQTLIEISGRYASKYAEATNDLKKSALRKDRKNELKKAFKNLTVNNWVGVLKDYGTTGDGQAWVFISIPGTSIQIETNNNRFSDMSDNTLIANGSKVYNQLINLEKGTEVYFSGKFLTDTDAEYLNYLKEMSITENGSMSEPEFIMKFSSITQK